MSEHCTVCGGPATHFCSISECPGKHHLGMAAVRGEGKAYRLPDGWYGEWIEIKSRPKKRGKPKENDNAI